MVSKFAFHKGSTWHRYAAASVNFAVVPVRFQVLYMSCCSIVWNYILSQAVGKALPEAQAAAGEKNKNK